MTNPKAGRRAAVFAALLALVAACDAGTPSEPVQATLSAQSSSNSSAADACRNGGYPNLSRADGSAFKNLGDCVSYATQGGSFAPVITSFVLNGNDCNWATYTAVFSGGTGVVGGETVTSGVPFTRGSNVLPILVVTNAHGVSVTASLPSPFGDGSCWV